MGPSAGPDVTTLGLDGKSSRVGGVACCILFFPLEMLSNSCSLLKDLGE